MSGTDGPKVGESREEIPQTFCGEPASCRKCAGYLTGAVDPCVCDPIEISYQSRQQIGGVTVTFTVGRVK